MLHEFDFHSPSSTSNQHPVHDLDSSSTTTTFYLDSVHHFDSSTTSPELYSVLHKFELDFSAATTTNVDSSTPTTADLGPDLHEL